MDYGNEKKLLSYLFGDNIYSTVLVVLVPAPVLLLSSDLVNM